MKIILWMIKGNQLSEKEVTLKSIVKMLLIN